MPINMISTETILSTVQSKLEGEPSSSPEERANVRQRLESVLKQVASAEPHLRARCEELRQKLLDKYGDDGPTDTDRAVVPAKPKTSAMLKPACTYLCDLARALVVADVDADEEQVDEGIVRCTTLLTDLEEGVFQTDEEILWQINEVRKFCRGVKGVIMPDNDVIREPNTSYEPTTASGA